MEKHEMEMEVLAPQQTPTVGLGCTILAKKQEERGKKRNQTLIASFSRRQNESDLTSKPKANERIGFGGHWGGLLGQGEWGKQRAKVGEKLVRLQQFRMKALSSVQQSRVVQLRRRFQPEDIPTLLQKLFDQFDKDKNHRFTKNEFPRVLKALINMVGGEEPASDDIEDLFNLLDVNGDETIDRKEFTSLLTTFFRLLDQMAINVDIQGETDLLF